MVLGLFLLSRMNDPTSVLVASLSMLVLVLGLGLVMLVLVILDLVSRTRTNVGTVLMHWLNPAGDADKVKR